MDLKLTDKTALVSGSTKGIGFAIATGLACEGARVIVNGRSEKAVAEAKQQIIQTQPDNGRAAQAAGRNPCCHRSNQPRQARGANQEGPPYQSINVTFRTEANWTSGMWGTPPGLSTWFSNPSCCGEQQDHAS